MQQRRKSMQTMELRYGRKFVAAYVDFTHYVERLHMDAMGPVGHIHGKAEASAAPAHQH